MYRYSAGKVDWLANNLPSEGRLASEPRIGGIADPEVALCEPGERLGDVRGRLRPTDDVCVVVNSAKVVLGALRGEVLSDGARQPDARVEEVMDPAPSTFRPNVSVHEMAEHLGKTGAQRVLVTTGDGVLVGLLRREAVEQAEHAGGPYLATMGTP